MTQGVNWGDLLASSGGAFEPLPKGPYDVYVDTAEATRSSTDKLMFKVRFKVEGGPHNGRTIYHNIVLTPENAMAVRMFFLNMKNLGLDQQFFATNPQPEQVAAALVGQRATVVVDHRVYQGQTRENIKTLMPRAGGINIGGAMVAPAVASSGGPVAPGAPGVPTPGANPMVPSGMPPAAPVVSQPAPSPVPPPPPAPPAPAAVQAPTVESTAAIPQPENPAPPADLMSKPGNGGQDLQPGDYGTLPGEQEEAPADPQLPPGMTPEMFEQFKAFQAAQAAAAAPAAPPAPAQPAPPSGAPAYPLPGGEAF